MDSEAICCEWKTKYYLPGIIQEDGCVAQATWLLLQHSHCRVRFEGGKIPAWFWWVFGSRDAQVLVVRESLDGVKWRHHLEITSPHPCSLLSPFMPRAPIAGLSGCCSSCSSYKTMKKLPWGHNLPIFKANISVQSASKLRQSSRDGEGMSPWNFKEKGWVSSLLLSGGPKFRRRARTPLLSSWISALISDTRNPNRMYWIT